MLSSTLRESIVLLAYTISRPLNDLLEMLDHEPHSIADTVELVER